VTVPDPGEDAWFHAHQFQPFLAALAGLVRRCALQDSAAGRARAIVQEARALAAGAAAHSSLISST
jgi:hypothetical protein